MLLEPRHGLQECLLFRKLDIGFREVSSQGKAMLGTAIQVDLVLLACLGEDFFGLVTLGRGENVVGF